MLTPVQTNPFATLLLDPTHHFGLPAELRERIYELIIQNIFDTFHQRDDPAVGTVFHTTSTPDSRKRATEKLTTVLLANHLLHDEFFARYVTYGERSCEVRDTLTGPRAYPPDTEREKAVMANAKCWELMGNLGATSFTGSPGIADYSVKIVLQNPGFGYRLIWQHLQDVDRVAAGLTKREYDAMLSRVEHAFVAIVAEREGMDGLERLVPRGYSESC